LVLLSVEFHLPKHGRPPVASSENVLDSGAAASIPAEIIKRCKYTARFPVHTFDTTIEIFDAWIFF